MTSRDLWAARDNPFPPEDRPCLVDAGGNGIWDGEEYVRTPDGVYRLDTLEDMAVRDLVSLFGYIVEEASNDY